jgi:hypothetical protein
LSKAPVRLLIRLPGAVEGGLRRVRGGELGGDDPARLLLQAVGALGAHRQEGIGERPGALGRGAFTTGAVVHLDQLGVRRDVDAQGVQQVAGITGEAELVGGEGSHAVRGQQLRLGLQVEQVLTGAGGAEGVALQRVDQDGGRGLGGTA